MLDVKVARIGEEGATTSLRPRPVAPGLVAAAKHRQETRQQLGASGQSKRRESVLQMIFSAGYPRETSELRQSRDSVLVGRERRFDTRHNHPLEWRSTPYNVPSKSAQ